MYPFVSRRLRHFAVFSLQVFVLLALLDLTSSSLWQAIAAETKSSPVLVTASAVRKLPMAEADRGLPVRLSAVVTFYDPQTDYLFVQDKTSGVFVQEARGTNLDLREGQLVELEGTTRHSGVGSIVGDAKIRIAGKGRLPSARPMTAESLFAGTEDTKWVEVEGIVNAISVAAKQSWLELDVAVLNDHFTAHIPGYTTTNPMPTWLIDTRVKLQGVVQTLPNRRGPALGFEMFVPSMDSLEVVRQSPKEPFSLPTRAINTVLQADSHNPPGHRVKVHGVVTLQWSDRQIYIQDDTGGIAVDLVSPLALDPGTRLDVVGFPKVGGYSAQLQQAISRKAGETLPVTALKTSARAVRGGELDSVLVQLDAVLTGMMQHQDVEVLTLQAGQWSFEALLKTNRVTGATEALRLGSRLRVTGVCEATANDKERPIGFRLLLRSAEDLQVLARPPWWTVRRVVTVLSLVTLGAAIWLLLYSQRVSSLQRQYRQLFENASDLVCSLDLQGRFTGLNKAGEKITGYSKAQAIGQSLEGWVVPENQTDFREWWHKLVTDAEPPPQEIKLVAKDGHEVALEISGRLSRERLKPVAVEAIARDITARKQAEEERLVMERKLLDSQKLESLGVMAGGIAHDFNNLLTAILGNAALAGLAAPEDSAQRNHLRNIEKASRQAADLCKQLLAYSGKSRFITLRVDLNAIIEDMEQLLQLSISKKATLEIESASRLPAIEADPSQIRQVLMNLVINASEALQDKNGTIRVRTGVLHADRASLSDASIASDLALGDCVFLEVSDTGCGMDRETLSKVLDPFFTTKFIGRGLGLAAVSGIVRAHRGALHIASEPGRGSTFRILLPSCGEIEEPVQAPAVPSSRWRGIGTVLVVDDEEGVRSITSHMLKSFGFDVLEAVNGEDAIATFRERAAEIVAVVLDLTMPRMSGEDTLRELRRLASDMPVLLISGFSDQQMIQGLGGHRTSDFLAKPFKPDELREKMRTILSVRREGDTDVGVVAKRF